MLLFKLKLSVNIEQIQYFSPIFRENHFLIQTEWISSLCEKDYIIPCPVFSDHDWGVSTSLRTCKRLVHWPIICSETRKAGFTEKPQPQFSSLVLCMYRCFWLVKTEQNSSINSSSPVGNRELGIRYLLAYWLSGCLRLQSEH